MESVKSNLSLLTVFGALIVLLHLVRPGTEAQYHLMTTIVNILVGLVPVAASIWAVRYFRLNSLQGKSIFFLGLSVVCWLIADILWSVFFDDALISVSDLFWLAGYPLILVSVFYGLKSLDPQFYKDRGRMFFSVLGMVLFGALYFSFFPLSWDAESTALINFLTSGYAIMDMLLVVPVLLLLSLAFKGKYSRPWILIGIAILLNFFGDVYYTANYGSYVGGDLIDLAWYIAYLAYAAAFILLRHNAERTLHSYMKKKA